MRKFSKGFVYAWSGLRVAFAEQVNLRVHVGISVLVIAAGFYFDIGAWDWLVLLLLFGLVLSAELFNSAIESLVDLVSPEHRPLAGKVKDIAAGAVLVTAVVSVVCGILIFWKYLVKWL